MKLVAFCEAPADFRIASELVDRVLREDGPGWVADVMAADPDGIRAWRQDGLGRSFFDLHRLSDYARGLSVRVPHGHFDGKPGAAGALMARTVFSIVRRLVQEGHPVDAVVLLWDMDDQPKERRAGVEQARAEAQHFAQFGIVLGCPNAMREAWVLVGFAPVSAEEITRLGELRRELGFAPTEAAHRLDAKDEQAKRSAKRVLGVLTAGDRDREQRCWTETPLATLRDRSAETGLKEFLDEVQLTLAARCAARTG